MNVMGLIFVPYHFCAMKNEDIRGFLGRDIHVATRKQLFCGGGWEAIEKIFFNKKVLYRSPGLIQVNSLISLQIYLDKISQQIGCSHGVIKIWFLCKKALFGI